jgi:hypothetical protein
MADTRRDGLLFTGLSAEHLDRAMEGCASRQKVLILDCCYSGAFPAGRVAKAGSEVHALERLHGRGRTVLTASDATQYSFEGNELHGEAARSVFTRYLVAGLRDGSADLDGDGDITLDELYAYAHDRVVAELPQQRPKKQDDVEGRMDRVTEAVRSALKHACRVRPDGLARSLAHCNGSGSTSDHLPPANQITRPDNYGVIAASAGDHAGEGGADVGAAGGDVLVGWCAGADPWAPWPRAAKADRR